MTTTGEQEGLRVATQADHLTSKYVGTGHPNTTRFEWACNVKRDTSAAVVATHSRAAGERNVESRVRNMF